MIVKGNVIGKQDEILSLFAILCWFQIFYSVPFNPSLNNGIQSSQFIVATRHDEKRCDRQLQVKTRVIDLQYCPE